MWPAHRMQRLALLLRAALWARAEPPSPSSPSPLGYRSEAAVALWCLPKVRRFRRLLACRHGDQLLVIAEDELKASRHVEQAVFVGPQLPTPATCDARLRASGCGLLYASRGSDSAARIRP